MYDYYLGGKDNFQVDRDAAREILRSVPELFRAARENRAFLSRAVRALASAGIDQFVDVGAGLPTRRNVHEIAGSYCPGARVVYVDNDPVVLTHARALLAQEHTARVVQADVRDPRTLVDRVRGAGLIDFGKPVAVLFAAVLHFVPDEADPGAAVRAFLPLMAPGSHVVITHGTRCAGGSAVEAVTRTYLRSTTPIHLRDPERINDFFDGFDLLDPGSCFLPRWRPEPDDDPASATRWYFGGVGRC